MKTSSTTPLAPLAFLGRRLFTALLVELLLNLALSFSAAAQFQLDPDLVTTVALSPSSGFAEQGTPVSMTFTVTNDGGAFQRTATVQRSLQVLTNPSFQPRPNPVLISPSSGASYNPSNGVVTLPTVTIPHTQSVSVTISFTMPNYEVTGNFNVSPVSFDPPFNPAQENPLNNGANAIVRPPAPLPVELKNFEAVAENHDALLRWTTASERSNDRFEIERSFDGHTFARVGTVRGQGTRTRPTDYGFTDAGAARLGSALAYYRLRQVDTDGTPSLSPVRVVNFTHFTKAHVGFYPNPAPGQTTLDLRQLPAGTYQVRVLDPMGRQVRTYALDAGQHPLNVQDLPRGRYVVRVMGKGVSLALPLVHE